MDTDPEAGRGILNRHSWWYPVAPLAIRPWIETAWSGTDQDIFPSDVIPTWRRNPPAADAQALVPDETLLGHGPFTFRLRRWDGSSWRVDLEGAGLRGWHGFDITADGGGTTVTHTLQVRGGRVALALARVCLEPLHDWSVEALLDRLGAATTTGAVPAWTTRPMGARAAATHQLHARRRIRNLHSRVFPASPEVVRPWIEWLWSGTDRDAFPRDRFPTFRRNPVGSDPSALIPGVTRIGHGPARFRFQKWDGEHWQAEIVSNRIHGYHGFRLTAEGQGARLTHVLSARLHPLALGEWAFVIRPLHDWAVEALFDRLATALLTARVPDRTERAMPLYARVVYFVLRLAEWPSRVTQRHGNK